MDIEKLKTELAGVHPGTGDYNADDAIAADQLNAVNRSQNRTSMTGSEILNAVDAGEWASRTAEQKRTVWDVIHMGTINPFGVEATLITDAFSGAEGVTLTALTEARGISVSRAVELGLGIVGSNHIELARRT